MLYTVDDLLCHLGGIQLQGILTAANKGRTHEAWADVMNADMIEAAYMAELGKAL